MSQPSFLVKLEDFFHGNFMHWVITLLVLVNGVVLGMKTEQEIMVHYGELLQMIDLSILIVLVAEILLRLLSLGKRFFLRAWNVFDFCIISVSLYAHFMHFELLEAVRVLLILRLIELLPHMKHVVDAIWRALMGLLNSIILLFIIFYMFAVAGTHLFGEISPAEFGNVGRTMFTLFQLMAFDELGNVIRPIMAVKEYAWSFFVLFLTATSFSFLNLFIGIIVNAMQEAAEEREKDQPNHQTQMILDALDEVRKGK